MALDCSSPLHVPCLATFLCPGHLQSDLCESVEWARQGGEGRGASETAWISESLSIKGGDRSVSLALIQKGVVGSVRKEKSVLKLFLHSQGQGLVSREQLSEAPFLAQSHVWGGMVWSKGLESHSEHQIPLPG